MKQTAFLFSGQGSQYPGMGVELYNACPTVPAIFECGSDILGIDLKEVCTNFTAPLLSQTEIAQPAIFTVSLAAFEGAKSQGIIPTAVCGHSLGEYAALVVSGMVSLEVGFLLIKQRAQAMRIHTENQNGAMAAIVGLSPDEVAAECQKIDGYVVPSNFNSLAQTVIAGEAAAVELAMEHFKLLGKKVAKLAVSAAFHTKLMQPAADAFYDNIKHFEFFSPTLDFYSNVTGQQLTDFSDMPTYLKSHIVSPVRFTDQLFAMKQAGIVNYIECGPGKVLSGLVKRTLKEVSIQNVEDERSLSCIKQN